MPQYAVLGATGNVGSAIVQALLSQPIGGEHDIRSSSISVNVLVRSKAKLHKLVPAATTDGRVQVYEGSIQDADIVLNCIDGADVVFMCTAVTANVPNCSIAMDSAVSVISALKKLRERALQAPSIQQTPTSTPKPHLIVLSSSSISHKLTSRIPALMHEVALMAFSNIYADLMLAEECLRSQQAENPELFYVTFVKPGGVITAPAGGHVLNAEQADRNLISFADCAAGMIEIAQTDNRKLWDGVDLSVNSAMEDGVPLDYAPLLYSWLY